MILLLYDLLVQRLKATLSVGKDWSQLRAWVGKAHSCGYWQYSLLAGHWTESRRYSLAVGWGRPSILCPQQLTTWQAAESNKKARRCREWISSMLEVTVSCSSVSAVTSHHFTIYYSLKASHRSMQHTRAGNYTVVWITGSVDNWGPPGGLASRDVY